MSGIFLHLYQLFVSHVIHVWIVRIVNTSFFLTSLHCHANEAFFFCLSLILTSAHHGMHHKLLFSLFSAALHFFHLKGHLQLALVLVLILDACSSAKSSELLRRSYPGARPLCRSIRSRIILSSCLVLPSNARRLVVLSCCPLLFLILHSN